MGAMRTHNPRLTPERHVLIHHVPEYMRRIGVQLGPTSEQALASQHTFLIFYTTNSRLIVRTPPSLENVYLSLYFFGAV